MHLILRIVDGRFMRYAVIDGAVSYSIAIANGIAWCLCYSKNSSTPSQIHAFHGLINFQLVRDILEVPTPISLYTKVREFQTFCLRTAMIKRELSSEQFLYSVWIRNGVRNDFKLCVTTNKRYT